MGPVWTVAEQGDWQVSLGVRQVSAGAALKMTEEQKDRFYESWKRAREAKKRAQETQNQMMGKRKRDGPGDGA